MTNEAWHSVEWTPERIGRFWDFVAHCEGLQADYFSRQVGAGVVRFLRYLVPMEGRILDYGCGPGYLAQHLLGGGIACEGLDFSLESVNTVNARFGGRPLWRGAQVAQGARLPYADGELDAIICVETIEHVIPGQHASFLGELRRVLKPGSGRLFFSTPNNENLSASSVCCPECGGVFHRYQHLSSFSKTSLPALLAGHGFNTVCCDATDFARFQASGARGPADWSWNYLGTRMADRWATLKDSLCLAKAPLGGYRFRRMIGAGPHLFWLGARSGE